MIWGMASLLPNDHELAYEYTTYPNIILFSSASWVNAYPETTLGRFGKQQVWNKDNKKWNDINSQCLSLFALFSFFLG
ncbi:hypothetical protein VNO77_42009 [Canavalia gladiata]|uniref:Uncharacterized protein n=1 Tax=Canavalia gladiata TaxID=3824 RepID=A0AAN9PQM6_CANGL